MKLDLDVFIPVCLAFFSVVSACGGASTSAPSPTSEHESAAHDGAAHDGAEDESAEHRSAEHDGAEPSEVDAGECPRTSEELARALRSVASHDVPPPTAEDVTEGAEWTDAFRAWNRLQSEALRVAEGSSRPGMNGRHRIWVHALRARSSVLERGPFEVTIEANGAGYFRAGAADDRASVTVRVVEESRCLRIDDR